MKCLISRGKLESRKWKNTTRRHPRMLPTGSAKTALLPAILGDVNAGGGGAPIERENEGEMEHFVTIENRKKETTSKKENSYK